MLETFAVDFDEIAQKPGSGPVSGSDPIVVSVPPVVPPSTPAPDPTEVPFLLTTSLSQPVKMGEKRLQVASQTGCEPGMTVKIGPHKDKSYETRRVSALGSLVLDYPLVNSYPAGTEVVVSRGKGGDRGSFVIEPATPTQPPMESDDKNKDKNKDNVGPSLESAIPVTTESPMTTTTTTTKPVKIKYTVGQRIQANLRGSGKEFASQSIRQTLFYSLKSNPYLTLLQLLPNPTLTLT